MIQVFKPLVSSFQEWKADPSMQQFGNQVGVALKQFGGRVLNRALLPFLIEKKVLKPKNNGSSGGFQRKNLQNSDELHRT